MERLPTDLCLNIFCWLDHQNLAAAHMDEASKTLREPFESMGILIGIIMIFDWKWRELASDDKLWCDLFKERWGLEQAAFYAPAASQSWKDVYIVQDRCDRVGLGLKIIREGDDYYLVHQGQIQRGLGSRRQLDSSFNCKADPSSTSTSSSGILDKILFFIGDMEAASIQAKRSRLL